MSFDDGLALAGLLCVLTGVFLWLGLPAMLILLGLALIYIGARIDIKAIIDERNKTADQR